MGKVGEALALLSQNDELVLDETVTPHGSAAAEHRAGLR
jgi:hypothetical protein